MMNKRKIKKKFKKFLEKHGATERYFESTWKTYASYEPDDAPECLISGTFIWPLNEWDYWNDLHEAWQKDLGLGLR